MQVTITIHNPDIISATVYSSDLVLTDPSNNAQMATGSFPSTTIHSKADSDIVATFNFPANPETVRFIATLYQGSSYTIHISGDIHIALGALSFTYPLSQDETVPAQ